MAALIDELVGRLRLHDDARRSAIVLAIRVLGAGMAYLSQVLLARFMGTSEFGLYSYALAWLSLFAIVAAFGAPDAAIRLLPQYAAKRQWDLVRGYIRFSTAICLSCGLLLVAAGGASLWLFGPMGDSQAIAIVAMLGVPILALAALENEIARSFSWHILAYGPRLLGRHTLLVCLVSIWLLASGTVSAWSALLMEIMGLLGLLAVQAVICRRRIARLADAAVPAWQGRYWLAQITPFAGIAVLNLLLDRLAVLMIGFQLDTIAVAYFSAAANSVALVVMVLFSVNAVIAPSVGRACAQDDMAELQRIVSRANHLMFWPSLATLGLLLLAGPYLLRLFGPGFDTAYVPLAILLAGQFVNAVTGPVGLVLHISGHQSIVLRVLIVSVVANALLLPVLIDLYGLHGAALANAGVVVLRNVVLTIVLWRRLGILSLVFSEFLVRVAQRRQSPTSGTNGAS